jgi:hypothetical protein
MIDMALPPEKERIADGDVLLRGSTGFLKGIVLCCLVLLSDGDGIRFRCMVTASSYTGLGVVVCLLGF